MEKIQRPIVLSIAGFDPCGGAGILADMKTFECIGVYGMGVITAYTLQTENIFETIKWRTCKTIQNEIDFLLYHYLVKGIKIGIVRDAKMLECILSVSHKKNIFIVWDTVFKSSTNKNIFVKQSLSQIKNLLTHIYCITPNFEEALILSGKNNIYDAGLYLSQKTNVIIKGGHNESEPGTDYLFLKQKSEYIKIPPQLNIKTYPKHGSGCVFSSALTSYLSKNYSLEEACKSAKKYTEKFLSSNKELLGYHNN